MEEEMEVEFFSPMVDLSLVDLAWEDIVFK